MKISLTLAEIKAMVAREYVLPDVFDLEIVDSPREESNDNWISNVGRSDTDHPDSLRPYTVTEIMYRCGRREAGYAKDWHSAWCETDGNEYSIIAYRILKD